MTGVQQFYNAASQNDFSRDFLFRVASINLVINKRDAVAGNSNVDQLHWEDSELAYVRTATLPGRNITNVEAKYMGLSFNIPGGVTYPGSDAYSLEFYCDSKSNLRERLLEASRATFDDITSTGLYGTPDMNSYIVLHQLDKDLQPVTVYTLVGTSIRNVSDISYEIAEGTGNVKTFTATFAYHYWVGGATNPGNVNALKLGIS